MKKEMRDNIIGLFTGTRRINPIGALMGLNFFGTNRKLDPTGRALCVLGNLFKLVIVLYFLYVMGPSILYAVFGIIATYIAWRIVFTLMTRGVLFRFKDRDTVVA